VQQDSLESFEVDLPELSEQRAIAATLGALDDKIESNRRTVALIPQLVRARVDASISQAGDRIAVAELAHFVNGGAYTKGATGTGRMVIRIAELNSGPGGSTVYNDIDVPDEKVARAGDILMSWSGSLGVYRWFRDEAIVNQHIFKVIPTGYPAWLVFDRLDAVMPIFRGVAADKATTMGHIQRGHLESTNVEIPVVSEIEQLNEMLSPLWGRLLSAEREVVRLTKLRDALLPELLSGRMRVPAEGVAA
jgi:type I restriction enzyme S subunit